MAPSSTRSLRLSRKCRKPFVTNCGEKRSASSARSQATSQSPAPRCRMILLISSQALCLYTCLYFSVHVYMYTHIRSLPTCTRVSVIPLFGHWSPLFVFFVLLFIHVSLVMHTVSVLSVTVLSCPMMRVCFPFFSVVFFLFCSVGCTLASLISRGRDVSLQTDRHS